jgi:hypothetical protein
VFVVDHLEGAVPTLKECQSFLERLKQLDRESLLRVLVPDWQGHDDFECPACRGNLFHRFRDGQTEYVDFQNFRLTSPAAWTDEVCAQARRLQHDFQTSWTVETYDIWWGKVASALAKRGVEMSRRTVIDSACGLGEILLAALKAGAGWGLGLTSTELLDQAHHYLWSHGVSRFMIGCSGSSPSFMAGESGRLQAPIVIYSPRPGDAGAVEFLTKTRWQALICHQVSGEPRTQLADLNSRLLNTGEQVKTLEIDQEYKHSSTIMFIREDARIG